MRVTQNSMSRQYMKNLGNNESRKLDYMNKIQTQRKFMRASENSIDASKAMTVRKQMRNLDIYDDNLNSAKELFTSAETNLYDITGKLYKSANTQLITASNGTYNTDDYVNFSRALEGIADNMMDDLNADFAERQIFGGTNNSTPPFTYQKVTVTNAGGDVLYTSGDKKAVCYNGVPVSMNATDIAAANVNGTYTVTYNGDASTAKSIKINFQDARTSSNNEDMFPGSKPIYTDVGLGIKYDSNYNVDPQTALDISLNGAKCSGNGTDSEGYSKNIVQLVYDAVEACNVADQDKLNKLIDKVADASDTVLNSVTTLGTEQNNIEFYLDKNDAYRTNLDEMQNDLETYDLIGVAGLYSDYQVADSAYQAALKLSSTVLPTSIFDFL